MSTEFSPVVPVARRQMSGFSGVNFVDVDALGVAASPVAVFDDFRVQTMPFSPHPHAGFAAVTYVMRDSPGSVRSRASSGEDVEVGPGGIVWTEAGSGVIHEEIPADPSRELHGVQLFVNLSSKNKLIPPKVRYLLPAEVPEWGDEQGNRVRVVVGSFEGIESPLTTTEPFTMLDADIARKIAFKLPAGNNAIVYVRSGAVVVGADSGRATRVDGAQAIALRGGPAVVTLEADEPSAVLVLGGPQINERVVTQGPFIMNDVAQIDAAIHRYRSGAMGHLEPVARRPVGARADREGSTRP